MGNTNSSPEPKGEPRPQPRPRAPFPQDFVGSGSGNSSTDGWVNIQNSRYHRQRSGGALAVTHSNSDDGNKLQYENGDASDLAEKLREQVDEEWVDNVSDYEEGDDVGGANDNSSVSSNRSKSSKMESSTLKVFKSSCVKVESKIGDGEFGTVSKAILQGKLGISVAIKVFNDPFENENAGGHLSKIMRLRHRNVVAVLGILDGPPNAVQGPQVVLHYFPEGNILQFLNKSESPQDYATLLKLASDVVQGCGYLHSKNIIHGNLAARNILIEKQRGRMQNITHYNAKVSDHGIIQLAKAKGSGKNYMEVHNRILPVRWVPMELLQENSNGFTFASDVWMFGITLWEVLTKGSIPYGKMKDDSEVIQLIRIGISPLDIRVPEVSSDEITAVMKRIFNVDPMQRPTFSQLMTDFASMTGYPKLKADFHKYSQNNSETKKSELLQGNQRKKEEEERSNGEKPEYQRSSESGHGARSRGRRGGRGSARGAGRLYEKLNLLKTSDGNRDSKAPLPGDQSNKSSKLVPEDQGRSSRQPIGCGNSYARRPSVGNRRDLEPSTSPPILAFQAMSIPSANNNRPREFSVNAAMPPMAPPPPPYTPNPLPNHTAYGANGAPALINMGPGGRNPYLSERDRKVNYMKEIKKKEQELEHLKIQQLRHEANEAWAKLNSTVSQLTEMRVPVPAPQLVPLAVGGRSSEQQQNDQSYGSSRGGSSRGGKPRGGRGGRGVRSQSRGTNPETSKTTPAKPTENFYTSRPPPRIF